MDRALGQGQGAIADVERQQQLTLGVHRDPDPLGHTLQALDGFDLTDPTSLDCAEQSKQLIELDVRDTHIVQDVSRKGLELLRCLHQPRQHGIRVNLEHPRGGANA
jgi:hypothetical protein